MSLKAKVEAIIYAAEEPITVEQIAQLLRDQILAEAARLEAEALAAAEAKATEEAQGATEAETVAAGADSVEAQDSATIEDNDPTLSLREKDGAPAETVEVPSVGVDRDAQVSSASLREPGSPDVEASTPLADEAAPVETPAEAPVADDAPTADAQAEQTTPEAPAEAAQEEPAPADSASVDAPAAPGKRQKKSKEELAVDAKVRARVRALIAELMADCASEDRGIEVRQVAGGYRMSTKPEHHDVVRAFAKSLKPPVRLSLAALETLAVIAYKQPITVPEISEIRGVESGGVIATLLDRKLITTAGRKQVIGRPILYKTAKEFLLRFGLNEISELPSMEEFEKLAAEGLGGEEPEQTTLDLQQQPASPSEATAPAVETPAPEATPAETAQESGPAEVGENADEPEESAAKESQSGTEAEEPQHS